MTPAQADDLLLTSLGSSLPPVNPNDWLTRLFLAWRQEVERKPMPEWVAA
jgi:hypothetical protein